MMPHRIYAMVGLWALAAGAVAQSDRPDAIGIPARTDQSPAAAAAVALPAGATIRVKTIHPKRGPEIAVSVEQPAEIAPYYKAELYAPIAGTVTFLEKSLGDAVSAGERLVEITPFGAGPEQPGLGVLRAPFEGVIAARSIDPGAFVPSATIVSDQEPLLVIQRTDIVTVSMEVPDTFARLVDDKTEAEIRMDSFPGRPLKCRLSRIAPDLSAEDRTRRVEVDLYNRSQADYTVFAANSGENAQAGLKGRKLPLYPTGLAEGAAAGLLPGMYGRMRLRFHRFENTPVVPSSAIVRRGGLASLYQVAVGKVVRLPVLVDFDDGEIARVLVREEDVAGERLRELRDDEEFIWGNQSEVEPGQPVQPALAAW